MASDSRELPATGGRIFFTSLLTDRPLALGLCGAATVHLGLRIAGMAGWPCPFLSATGVPCPGCGLSRAAVEFLGGHVAGALSRHAFAPGALVGLGLLLAAAVLPAEPRAWLIGWVRKVEERTRFAAWFLGALLLYWALRLTLDGAHFLSLVK